jgi:hypothetical protein
MARSGSEFGKLESQFFGLPVPGGGIGRRIRGVNREYDILYIAGYSADGPTVFIDRHLPRTFGWL